MLTSLKKLLPARLKHALKDRLEDLRRLLPVEHRGLPHFGLSESQVYPKGVAFDECLVQGTLRKTDGLVIARETPVASIGSCFAEEFAAHMAAAEFNYLKVEPNVFHASADWGRVYTIPNFRQIVEYSAAADYPLALEPSAKGWFDPLREYTTPFYPTREAAAEAVAAHRTLSRKAFSQAEVLIVTLGQNEAWVERRNGLVWARIPPKETLEREKDRFEARTFTYEENRAQLASALKALRGLNPKLRFLLTVSPVPAAATFTEPDVISMSMANKCLLRTVADRVVAEVPGVYYFPSFEMVLSYNPHSFRADNRHVKHAVVERIFVALRKTVVRS